MNFKIKNRTIVSLTAIIIILLSLTTVFASTTSNSENLLKEYYSSFQEKNIQRYLNSQYLDNLNSSELKNKKDYINKLWDTYDVISYRISNISTSDIDKDSIIASYNINTKINIKNSSTNNKEFAYSMNMVAIIYKNKILKIIPASIFDYNTGAILKINNLNSQKEIYNITKETNNNYNNTNKTESSLNNTNNDTLEKLRNLSVSLESYPLVKRVIGKNKKVKLVIKNKTNDFYFKINDTHIASSQNIKESDLNYIVIVNSETINRLIKGSDPLDEFNSGNIEVKGVNIGSKVKLFFIKIGLKIYSWFRGKKKDTSSIVIIADEGSLTKKSKYDFIGNGPRNSKEVYLAAEGSSVKYNFKSDNSGIYNLYIGINDDGKHSNGKRDATIET
ncbi:MAG: hypothetical protein GWP09_03065 [Nitrospiraceae bacterium]|nr:hypothetical protein [Nitrospiraceae bacterium]